MVGGSGAAAVLNTQGHGGFHFSDHRVISLYKRPFAAMDEALIELWNATVNPDDHIWHLGDFARGNTGAAILPRQADVGADVWDCRPVTLAEIKTRKPPRKPG
ncbi:MAG: hypothetical protein H7Z12_20410 [Rhodospirillaceae bacterium]|nr:hypothetical protein [Rhodospirillales bacterium]